MSRYLDLKLKGLLSDSDDDGCHHYYDSEHNDSEDDDDINLGLSLNKLNLGPKKKLLILGLGGLLVHRVYRNDPKPAGQRFRRPDAVLGNFNVYKRPFCSEFLNFCLQKFEVGIWSSARERNVDKVLNTLMKGLKNKLLFIWDQEECTDSGFMSLDKKDKPIFLKELSKVWNKNNQNLGKYNSSNTLMVDDEPYKALLNPDDTAVFPTTYKVENGDDKILVPKGELWKFLDGFANADDVRSYVNENQIGQPAVTKSHPDWEYYSKIKRRFVESD